MALPLIAAIAGVVGTGVSVYSAVASGNAQAEADEYNAKVAENNAIAAGDQANYEADQRRSQTRRLLATQKASALKSGVTEGGSFLNVQQDTAIQAEMDALAAIYQGKVSANSSSAQAALSRASARNARTGGLLTATGTAFGGISSAASKWPTTGTKG